MKKLLFVILSLFSSASVGVAHEMTPTYPTLEPSYMDGVYQISMNLFNAREEVEYYEIGVYDDEWNPIPFAATNRIIHVPYHSRATFDVYLRKADKDKVTYICTLSRLKKEDVDQSAIASRICSKIKRDEM